MAKTATRITVTPPAPAPAPANKPGVKYDVGGSEVGGGAGTKPYDKVSPDPYNPSSGNTWYSNEQGQYYVVDPSGNFLAGNNPTGYAAWYAGNQPNGAVGSYQDAQSQADKAAAQGNYGAGLANNDLSLGNLATNFADQLAAINKGKGKSLGSLAESMADRGLSSSGIFLKSTDDTNDRYNDQTAAQTRSHDQQFNQIQTDRTNLANALAQALTTADTGAYQRALAAWSARRDQAIAAANQRLKDLGLA